jgi:hypothetical protein
MNTSVTLKITTVNIKNQPKGNEYTSRYPNEKNCDCVSEQILSELIENMRKMALSQLIS